ncbi:hypothetical protein DICPUDRAFT_56876 [Dictyostelium purpureum]|uniref:RGS domain-containing protein n=1 Tax=Dictyostelium purpureum TaxID=5786 RepID=F0ZTG7_DICPU|nr:uncharacterized protein DICPUDRAFT_56876 [Dictyostelium purpureum]EGC32747.1 hypothetical protein DICPUDRAFT_56876 [Dictyostelium purpureum]|eukprot:XP_003290710.1 hypothetical protein DICPUDRAFT_56876 [Dictyostelium purpureum]
MISNFFNKSSDKEYSEEDFKNDSKTLYKSIKEGNVKQVKKLLSSNRKGGKLLTSVDDLDQSPLMISARNNNLEMFELILSYYKICKVDINNPDKNGYTCLHHFLSMSNDINPNIISILLEIEDIHVNVNNRDLNTPFHYFCQKFRAPNNGQLKEIFDNLIKKGVNVNAINKNGESPLHKAIFNTTVAQSMITLLLENKSNVNVVNKNGESPLHYCVRMGRADLVTILLQYGADRTAVAKDNKPLYQIAIDENFTKLADLLKDGGDLSKISDGASTELMSLLQNPTLREDFRKFLREELICEENINFWTDVEAYKYLKVDYFRLLKEFYRIYDKYILDNSPFEINIPYTVKYTVLNFKKNLPPQISPSASNSSISSSNSNENILNLNGNNNSGFSLSTTPNNITTSSLEVNSTIDPNCSNNNILNNNNSNLNSNGNNNNYLCVNSANNSSSASSSNQSSPIISGNNLDIEKLQSIFNTAQCHIFNLMCSDSLSKYKKKSFLNK